MNRKNGIKPFFGIVCIALVLVAVVVAVILDSQSPEPFFGIIRTESTASADESPVTTELAQDSSEETTASAESTGEASPETRPATFTEESSTSTEESSTSTEESSTPTEESSAPTEESSTPTEESSVPTEESSAPTEGSSAPTEESSTPAENPSAPSKDPSTPPQEQPTKPSAPEEEPLPPPEELPPSVIIPPQTDPETDEQIGISFPCQIPGYGLTIEKMAPYTGLYVEDGTNATVENVAMLLVSNHGDYSVEYTQIRVMCGQEELLFDISALPAGERVVVQEKSGKTISEETADSASALIVQQAQMEMSEDMVKVTDNGDNTLTIENLTDKAILTVRVFYKYYMDAEELFVGGIAFTVRILRLDAGASVTIQPSHYTSQSSRVVMVTTYDSEV